MTEKHPRTAARAPTSDCSDIPGDLDEALRLIAAGTVAYTGDEYFRSLVQNLAQALRVDFAFVTEFPGSGTRVRILARWERDHFGPNSEFDISTTPCRDVIAGKFTHYTAQVAKRFPDDPMLSREKIESYLGVPLRDRDKKGTLGHLVIMDTRPFAADTRNLHILEIFAARARVELERMRFEQSLEESERRLSSVLSSAMDAIITVDSELKITLCNSAAEKVFGCRSAELMQRSFDSLMSPRFREFFGAYLSEYGQSSMRRRQFWAPAGLTALRTDGSEFPIEATVSPLELGGESYFTFILRDVNERHQAERMLRKLETESHYLRAEVRAAQGYTRLLGNSSAMEQVKAQIERVAPTSSTVLITGETGTGKELIAHAIHEQSRRADRLLVKLNCAALPRELVESELFGHEKGAFTGAIQQKKGRFELANKGTLFLDEVAELSPETQAKLLRVLQEQEFERVGGTESIKVDVRVIAATNRDLAELVKKGEFRPDLFYRLNIFPMQAPPLRERMTDLAELVHAFAAEFAASMGKSIERVGDAALAELAAYDWPGNVRELRNVIERATILCDGPVLELTTSFGNVVPVGGAIASSPAVGLTLVEVEREHVRRVLASTGWVIEGKRGAANLLGLHPNTLRARLAKLGLRRPDRGAVAV